MTLKQCSHGLVWCRWRHCCTQKKPLNSSVNLQFCFRIDKTQFEFVLIYWAGDVKQRVSVAELPPICTTPRHLVEHLKCWTNRLMFWDITIWHFPSGGNPPYDYLWPSDIFQQAETHNWTTCDILHQIKTNQWVFFTTVWHFPSNRNSKMDFLWPSDIFHQVQTHHMTICDRLTFSNW